MCSIFRWIRVLHFLNCLKIHRGTDWPNPAIPIAGGFFSNFVYLASTQLYKCDRLTYFNNIQHALHMHARLRHFFRDYPISSGHLTFLKEQLKRVHEAHPQVTQAMFLGPEF